MIHLVPVKDALVRDPETKQVIGAEGIKVEAITPYLYRRMQDGELEEKVADVQVASLTEDAPVASKKKGDK